MPLVAGTIYEKSNKKGKESGAAKRARAEESKEKKCFFRGYPDSSLCR